MNHSTLALATVLSAQILAAHGAVPERGQAFEAGRSSLRPLRLGIQAGSDTCATAVDLTAALPCDGNFYMDEPMGIGIAGPSPFPSGSCWATADAAQNDVWYRWTNAAASPMAFQVSTDDVANVGGDSQIAVYSDCTGAIELACSDDDGIIDFLLSDTGPFSVPAGATIFIQLDGYLGNRAFERGLFRCAVAAPVVADSCLQPVALGSLSPSLTGPVVDRNGEPQPSGPSDYNEVEPTFMNVLDQPEACYTFTAMADGWVQIAATPTSNNGRVIFSADLGLTWRVANQCWSNMGGGYDTSPQFGTQVSSGSSYCFCVDSAIAPLVDPGDVWDLEMHYWPQGGRANRDCATAQRVDFCASQTVNFPGLSTVGAGQEPGIDPATGCGGTFWDLCSGFGADINYDITWTQRMVDCGCTGFRVTQTSPDLGTDARVCDAAIQIGTACPPTPATCVATVDDGLPGTPEVATVTGLGAAQVGTTYHVQLDTYMQSACPSFDATFDLLGCNLALCGGTLCAGCSLPAGTVGNALRAVRRGGDVELNWPTATVAPPNFVVYKTALKTELPETALGIGDEMLLTTLTATMHTEIGAVAPPSPWFYEVLPADSCDQPVFP